MLILTNNHEREFLYRCDLSDDEVGQFEWSEDETGFIRYKGCAYHLSEFLRVPDSDESTSTFSGWQGYKTDSFFSGVLIRISEDGDTYQIATYIA
tara:strand:- start:968 stop:1252 length:285 start_codon:yes stop_codon:yes gene_type:complete